MKRLSVPVNDPDDVREIANKLGLTHTPSSIYVEMDLQNLSSSVRVTAHYTDTEPYYQRDYIVPYSLLSETVVSRIIDLAASSIEGATLNRKSSKS